MGSGWKVVGSCHPRALYEYGGVLLPQLCFGAPLSTVRLIVLFRLRNQENKRLPFLGLLGLNLGSCRSNGIFVVRELLDFGFLLYNGWQMWYHDTVICLPRVLAEMSQWWIWGYVSRSHYVDITGES